jgi:hypothetical protein
MMNADIRVKLMGDEIMAMDTMGTDARKRFGAAWGEPLLAARKAPDPEVHELLLNIAVLSSLTDHRLSHGSRRRFAAAIAKGIDNINVRAP